MRLILILGLLAMSVLTVDFALVLEGYEPRLVGTIDDTSPLGGLRAAPSFFVLCILALFIDNGILLADPGHVAFGQGKEGRMKIAWSAGSASAIGALSYPSTGTVLLALVVTALIGLSHWRQRKRRKVPVHGRMRTWTGHFKKCG